MEAVAVDTELLRQSLLVTELAVEELAVEEQPVKERLVQELGEGEAAVLDQATARQEPEQERVVHENAEQVLVAQAHWHFGQLQPARNPCCQGSCETWEYYPLVLKKRSLDVLCLRVLKVRVLAAQECELKFRL